MPADLGIKKRVVRMHTRLSSSRETKEPGGQDHTASTFPNPHSHCGSPIWPSRSVFHSLGHPTPEQALRLGPPGEWDVSGAGTLTEAPVSRQLLVDLLHSLNVETTSLCVIDNGPGVVHANDALGGLLN